MLKPCSVLVETLYGEEAKLHSDDQAHWFIQYLGSNEDIPVFSSKIKLTIKQANEVFESTKDVLINRLALNGQKYLDGTLGSSGEGWKFGRK